MGNDLYKGNNNWSITHQQQLKCIINLLIYI